MNDMETLINLVRHTVRVEQRALKLELLLADVPNLEAVQRENTVLRRKTEELLENIKALEEDLACSRERQEEAEKNFARAATDLACSRQRIIELEDGKVVGTPQMPLSVTDTQMAAYHRLRARDERQEGNTSAANRHDAIADKLLARKSADEG